MEDLEIAATSDSSWWLWLHQQWCWRLTYQENERAFNHQLIIPHVLKDVELPDTTTHFDKETLTAIIIMAPVAAHGSAV